MTFIIVTLGHWEAGSAGTGQVLSASDKRSGLSPFCLHVSNSRIFIMPLKITDKKVVLKV